MDRTRGDGPLGEAEDALKTDALTAEGQEGEPVAAMAHATSRLWRLLQPKGLIGVSRTWGSDYLTPQCSS